jgi:hypothetical protein
MTHVVSRCKNARRPSGPSRIVDFCVFDCRALSVGVCEWHARLDVIFTRKIAVGAWWRRLSSVDCRHRKARSRAPVICYGARVHRCVLWGGRFGQTRVARAGRNKSCLQGHLLAMTVLRAAQPGSQSPLANIARETPRTTDRATTCSAT